VPPRRVDRADQQDLSVSLGAVDEQRCERQDDPGEAGRQGQHGGVSWRGRHQPIRHARLVTSAHLTRRKWAKSSLASLDLGGTWPPASPGEDCRDATSSQPARSHRLQFIEMRRDHPVERHPFTTDVKRDDEAFGTQLDRHLVHS
jgi:hypothetical protein